MWGRAIMARWGTSPDHSTTRRNFRCRSSRHAACSWSWSAWPSDAAAQRAPQHPSWPHSPSPQSSLRPPRPPHPNPHSQVSTTTSHAPRHRSVSQRNTLVVVGAASAHRPGMPGRKRGSNERSSATWSRTAWVASRPSTWNARPSPPHPRPRPVSTDAAFWSKGSPEPAPRGNQTFAVRPSRLCDSVLPPTNDNAPCWDGERISLQRNRSNEPTPVHPFGYVQGPREHPGRLTQAHVSPACCCAPASPPGINRVSC